MIKLKSLALEDMTDEHLDWMARLDKAFFDKAPAKDFFERIANGICVLWEIYGDAKGIAITMLTDDTLWIDAVAGDGLALRARGVTEALRDLQKKSGRPHMRSTVSNPVLTKLYLRIGYKPIATVMEI